MSPLELTCIQMTFVAVNLLACHRRPTLPFVTGVDGGNGYRRGILSWNIRVTVNLRVMNV